MNTSQLDAAIRSHIDQFLVSISGLVRQAAVEAVREALGTGGEMAAAPTRRGPGKPRKSAGASAAPAATGKRGRRSSADVDRAAADVLAYVKANQGQRLEEIGRGLGADTAGLKRPIQSLLAAGALRTEGQKRGTKYFLGGRGGSPERGAARRGRKAGKRSGRAAAKKAGGKGRKSAKAALLLLPEAAAAA
jgi:hypothetical protein